MKVNDERCRSVEAILALGRQAEETYLEVPNAESLKEFRARAAEAKHVEIPEVMHVLAEDCCRDEPSAIMAPAYKLEFKESKLVFKKDEEVLQAFFSVRQNL